MGFREERVGRNEASARRINESIEQLASPTAAALQIVCECSRKECMRLLEVSHDIYELVRQAPARFIVASGHQQLEFERVVSEHAGFVIVEKIGDAAEAAAQLDPRS